MAEYGLTDDGIESPAYNEIISFLAQKWKEEFGQETDLSSRTPEGQFLRIMALMFTNKGMEWSDVVSLWDVLLDLYFSAYVGTATGISLDHAVDRRGLIRKSAQNATGVLVFSGDSGETVPMGTSAYTQSGIEFVTTRPATITKYNVIPVPAKAVESGEAGNVVTDTIINSDSYDVNNPIDSHQRVLGSVQGSWSTIENNSSTDKYQVFNTKDVKYPTNVNEFSLTVRANQSGLYGIRLILMNHDSGQTIYRSETQEVTLSENEERILKFTGEHLDINSVQVGDQIRVAIQNHAYSTDNIDVAIDDQSSYTGWYHNTAEQPSTLVMSLTSEVNGVFRGGRDAESDEELRTRYQNELDRGGGNRVNAIEAELYEIPSLKHAKVYENETHHDLRDGGGLPPHSIEAVTLGGSKQEIMEVLLTEKSAGTNLWGNRVGTITDSGGQTHRMRWSRADETKIYLGVELVTRATFPSNGAKQVKDECASVIGGENTDQSFLNGQFGVGDTIYQSEVESELHDNINGIKSVEVLMGRTPDDLQDDDIEVNERESIIVTPETISTIE